MKLKKISNILWVFPFCAFIFGYYLLHVFLQKKELEAPNIIGNTLQASMNILSQEGLSLRLLREQEDPDLPEGVVLDQIPKPKQKIRPNHNLFVTISKKPKATVTPDLLGQNQKFITKQSTKIGIRPNIFWMKSLYPSGTCVAQYPQPDQELVDGKLVTYLSAGGQGLYVVPNLKDCFVCKAQDFFKNENIKIEVFHIRKVDSTHVCQNCRVVDQKPMSGSIVDLNKTLYMQIQVED